MVIVLPGVFLAVAAFLLNVVFSRLVTLQRGQIAVIKAVGYRNSTIAVHYLKMVCVIVFVGSLCFVALFLALSMTDTSEYQGDLYEGDATLVVETIEANAQP